MGRSRSCGVPGPDDAPPPLGALAGSTNASAGAWRPLASPLASVGPPGDTFCKGPSSKVSSSKVSSSKVPRGVSSSGPRHRAGSRLACSTKRPTKAVAGLCTKSIGEAHCSSRPWFRIATRSATAKASWGSWVTSRAQAPQAASTAGSSLRSRSRTSTSRLEKGSSSSTTLGWGARARARASRWRCPPES